MNEDLIWPRIIYHPSEGTHKSEKGISPAYTYDICETEEKFKKMVERGWSLLPDFTAKAYPKADIPKETQKKEETKSLNDLMGTKKELKKKA